MATKARGGRSAPRARPGPEPLARGLPPAVSGAPGGRAARHPPALAGVPAPPPAPDPRMYGRLLAHDVLNLASGMQMQLELAMREDLPGAARARLEALQGLAGRMVALVRNVQALEEPGPEPVLQTMDLRWALDQTLDAVRAMFPRAGLRVVDALGPGPRFVLADPSLEQALFNVLMNAVHHNPRDPPRLWLRPEASQGPVRHVVVRIEDDGPGMPPDWHRGPVPAAPGSRRVGLQAAAVLLARLGGSLEMHDRLPGQPREGTSCRIALRAGPSRVRRRT